MNTGRAAVLLLPAVLFLSACGGTTTANTATPGPATPPAGTQATLAQQPPPRGARHHELAVANDRIKPADADRTDPGAVAKTVAVCLATIDTTVDDTAASAAARCLPWLTPELLDGMLASPARSNQRWLQAAAHDGYTRVTADLANEYGQPPNTPHVAYETVSYTVHTIYRDGTTPPAPLHRVWRMVLIRGGPGWAVSEFLP